MTEGLDASYWRRRTRTLLVGMICGFLGVAIAMTMPAANRGAVLVVVLIAALLCSPFTLKTAAGRLWWGTHLVGIGSGIAAVLLGAHSPLGWLCAVMAACAYAVGVCLRWNPPAERR